MSFQALLFCPDEKTARVIAQVLQELDFNVETNAEPFAAVKKLTAERFDAVVVDCQNEQNASLVFKSARNSSLNQSSLMVAVVEGQAGVASAFRIGANLVLTKPIAIEQARGTLRVARGLLRKNEGSTQAAAVSTPSAPSLTPRLNLPSQPIAPPKPATISAVPAASPAVLRPVASVSDIFEKTVEPEPMPDEAEVGLLEALEHDSSPASTRVEQVEPAASVVIPEKITPAASTLSPSTLLEPKVSAPQPIAKAVLPGALPGPAFSSGAAAAPAPAKEHKSTSLPVAAKTLDEIPPEIHEQVKKLSAPSFSISDPVANEEKRSKLPLIGVLVLIAALIAGYFGWTKFGKSEHANPAPLTAEVPAASIPQSHPQAEAPAPGTSTTPASETTASEPQPGTPAPEITLKTATPEKTTQDKAVSPKPASKTSEPALHSEPVPIHVKTDTRLPASSKAAPEQVQAPSLVSANGGTDALNAIVSSQQATIPKAAQTLRVSQGVSEGLVLHRIQPVYPQQALHLKQEGTVVLQALVAKDGSIKDLKQISGSATLGRAAIDAVRQWKYKPYYLNGEPVEIQTQVSVVFKLPN